MLYSYVATEKDHTVLFCFLFFFVVVVVVVVVVVIVVIVVVFIAVYLRRMSLMWFD